MSDFYQRKAELIIENNKWLHPEITMNFNIEFDAEDDPNVSKISIFNLSEPSISSIKKGDICIFNAGYKDDIGGICNGVIFDVFTTKQNNDTKTDIRVIDVTGQYLNKTISKTYLPNANAQFILTDLFAQIGITPNRIELLENKIYFSGFTAYGKVQDSIRRIVKDCGSELTTNNSTIDIAPPQIGVETGYLLTPKTGLLNVTKIDNPNSQAQYKITMLLNHNVHVKSLLQVQSKFLDGIVMVVSGKHNDWKTTAEVVTVG